MFAANIFQFRLNGIGLSLYLNLGGYTNNQQNH